MEVLGEDNVFRFHQVAIRNKTMVWKTAFFYRKEYSQHDLQKEIVSLQSSGIHLLHPSIEQVSVWTQDGEQIFITREELFQRIRNRQTISFQYWLNDGKDLYHRVRFLGANVIEEYGLDGFGDQQPFIIRILLNRFKAMMENGGIGFVIDSTGVTEEYNWDDFFLTLHLYDGNLPHVMGLSGEQLDRLKVALNIVRKEEIGDFIILYRSGID